MKGVRVVFPAPRQVTLEEYEVPTLRPGQVLLQTETTLISTGTELTGLTGDFPPDSAWARYVRYPWYPGYSHVGRVLAAGPSSSGENEAEFLRPGTLVISQGAHASLVVTGSDRVRRLPDGVGTEEAAFAMLAATVMNGVRRARIELGEVIAVVGAGLLGQLCAQFARLCGGYPVLCIDLSEHRLRVAARLGATHALCVPVDDAHARSEVQRLTGGRGVDVAFEVTGHPAVVAPLLRLLRREGRAILLGSTRGPSQIDLHDEVHSLGLHVIGAHASTHPAHETGLHPWTRERNIALFLNLLEAGRVDVRSLITHHYPATGAAAAFDMLLHDRTQALGVILDWTGVQ